MSKDYTNSDKLILILAHSLGSSSHVQTLGTKQDVLLHLVQLIDNDNDQGSEFLINWKMYLHQQGVSVIVNCTLQIQTLCFTLGRLHMSEKHCNSKE